MKFDSRFFVPDLSPQQRREVRNFFVRHVFVAESPHTSEIEAENEAERRPLCGAAGKRWWRALGELLEGRPLTDLSAASLKDFCARHELAVLNAVQYPLDPAVMRLFPKADPVEVVGFSKAPGPNHYKKMKSSRELRESLELLRKRLTDPALAGKPVHCLGKDSEWFVRAALPEAKIGWIPHPSAWWRRGGKFEEDARRILGGIFNYRSETITG